MAIKFSNCEFSVDGSKILAQSASISQKNSITAISLVGYKNVTNNRIPIGPLTNSISVSYILETNNEPNYYLSRALINYNNSSPTTLNIANVVATGYLESYSINVSENAPVTATANYLVFHEINCDVQEQSSTGYLGFNSLNSLGVAHYWSTRLYDQSLNSNGSVIGLSYNFKANWSPVYQIGNKTPSQVVLLGGEESFDISSEYNLNILYSGQSAENSIDIGDCAVIELNNLSKEWTTSNWYPLYLYPSGAAINSHDTELSDNNIIISQTKLVKPF